MSKIELTEQQAQKLHTAWCAKEGVGVECYGATLNKAIELGLVRPASDDLAARVAALEAKVNAPPPVYADAFGPITIPDPHAAAKERAKLWVISFLECERVGFRWVSASHAWRTDLMIWEQRDGNMLWGMRIEDQWSNFPTVPPPGWEEKDDDDRWAGPRPTPPKPRTEGDRLGEVAKIARQKWIESGPIVDWRSIALAVRKADRAAQLEPTEEEKAAASRVYDQTWDAVKKKDIVTAILIAAARVRLAKAEGER